MQLVSRPIRTPTTTLREVSLKVGRLTLAKRLWRGVADDGTEFGFELGKPLQPGDTFWQTAAVRYVIVQQPEPVVEISLAVAPSAAAGIGWAVGNLHLELQAEPARLLALDEPAVRQLLARLNVPFTPTTAVFRPGRFSRGNLPTHELGPSHQH
jgi:urease accessory protein